MSQCWQFVPEDRPTFTELIMWTENMLKNSGDYLDLSPTLVNNVTYLHPLFLPGNSKIFVPKTRGFETFYSADFWLGFSLSENSKLKI